MGTHRLVPMHVPWAESLASGSLLLWAEVFQNKAEEWEDSNPTPCPTGARQPSVTSQQTWEAVTLPAVLDSNWSRKHWAPNKRLKGSKLQRSLVTVKALQPLKGLEAQTWLKNSSLHGEVSDRYVRPLRIPQLSQTETSSSLGSLWPHQKVPHHG